MKIGCWLDALIDQYWVIPTVISFSKAFKNRQWSERAGLDVEGHKSLLGKRTIRRTTNKILQKPYYVSVYSAISARVNRLCFPRNLNL